MSRLMDEIEKDPHATFEIEMDLPSGNRIRGMVGPMVGNRLCCNLGFRQVPTDDEMKMTKGIMNELIGSSPQFSLEAKTDTEADSNLARAEKFLREGLN